MTVPLVRSATVTVFALSPISGLRYFEFVRDMTGGGPGSSSDLIAAVICEQYQADLYALAMAGKVILFGLIALVVLPLTYWLKRREVDL